MKKDTIGQEGTKGGRTVKTFPAIFLGSVFLCALALFVITELFRSRLYFVLSAPTYLLFHNIVELFSVIVSFSIFLVGVLAYRQSKDERMFFLSWMFFGVGLIDFMHALSFPGMPVFITQSSTNKGILFWISARLLFACAFLISAYIPQRSERSKFWKQGVIVAAVVIPVIVFVGAIFYEHSLPAMFVPGAGITLLKKVLEYVVAGLLMLAYGAYLRMFLRERDTTLLLYLAALNISIFSELAFTLYASAYDTFNALGHVYKLVAFCFIYAGIFTISVKRPYAQLSEATVELRRDEERLKELDRLKDDFLMVATHELKSPLMPIKAQSQLLLAGDHGALNEKQKEAVEMIYRNEEAASTLASEVLDIAKIKSNKLKLVLESVSIGDIVTEAVDDLRGMAEQKQLAFTLLPIPKVPMIMADEARVKQVMLNLLDNAIKFTPERGTVTIGVEKKEYEVVIWVKDSGIGLGKEEMAKLFTPFYRVESDVMRKYRGTGLGLAITKSLVEAHGGTIRVESEGASKGSTFIVSLPLVIESDI